MKTSISASILSLIISSITTEVDGFVVVTPSANRLSTVTASPQASKSKSSTTSLFYELENTAGGGIQFVSPVLQNLYPALLTWKAEYGHPNIPLGNSEGRQCATLRRLHIQNKLTEEEVEWLEELGFTFHNLEDVYHLVDFDTLFDRLMDYEAGHPDSNFQVPKKCAEDPELGAWVTGLRRLGPTKVQLTHAEKLESVGFNWVSKRKCGSKFMLRQKELFQMAEELTAEGISQEQILQALLEEPDVKDLIKAQKQIEVKGKMSDTRKNYMTLLFGQAWTSLVWLMKIDKSPQDKTANTTCPVTLTHRPLHAMIALHNYLRAHVKSTR